LTLECEQNRLDLLQHSLSNEIQSMNIHLKTLGLSAALLLAGAAAQASDTYVNATVGGVLAPGVYGRIDIGNAPPPPVIYGQPMIIQRPVGVVSQRPLYMYVPPGHAKKWSKHCAKYNACGQPVYFVNADSRGKYVYQNHDHRDDRRHGYDDDRRDKGHGRGRGHDN
jgi:hypothetical protein